VYNRTVINCGCTKELKKMLNEFIVYSVSSDKNNFKITNGVYLQNYLEPSRTAKKSAIMVLSTFYFCTVSIMKCIWMTHAVTVTDCSVDKLAIYGYTIKRQ